jgi:hypothetical protein
MGLHDRDWYQAEMQKKAGRPVTFEQKMAASAQRHQAHKPISLLSDHRHHAKNQGSPVKIASITIAVLALIAIGLKMFLTR